MQPDNLDPIIMQNDERHETLRNVESLNEAQLVKQDEISEGIQETNKNLEHLLLQGDEQKNQSFEIEANDQNSLALWNLLRGPKGNKGDKGDKGETGENAIHQPEMVVEKLKNDEAFQSAIKGEKGDKGDTGKNGRDGLNGMNGSDGAPGIQGPQGEQGMRGERGLKGPKGDKGNDGKDVDEKTVKEIMDKADFAVNRASKTVSLVELDDVDLSGVTQTNGKYVLGGGGGGSGDVVGPASATANGVALFDTTTGKLIKNSTNFVQTATGVGIGTVTPTTSLDVRNTTTSGTILGWNTRTTGTNYGVDGEATGSDATLNIGGYFIATGATTNYALNIGSSPAAGANNYALYSASAAQSYFAGNIGIGTTAPATALEIGTTSSINNYVKVVGSNTDNTYLVFSGQRKYPKFELVDTYTGGSTFNMWNLGNTMRFGTDTGSSGTAAWYTKAGIAADVIFNGNLGIGTASPTSPLHVAGTTNDGSSLSQLAQSGTGRALYITRNVSAATRSLANIVQLSATGGAEAALDIQQATTASPAIKVTSDGSNTVFAVTGAGGLELGHATDTTLTRVSAGVVAVEGVRVKTTTPLVVSAASYTTSTGTSLNMDNLDQFIITAQAGALLFNAPGGTLVQGRSLVIRIKDNGTARALTWNAVFRAMGTALPTTTVVSKTLYLGFFYNSTDTKWDLVASAQEA